MMNLWGRILRWSRWEVCITAPRRDKCVICVAPHTSNMDFFLGLAAYRSLGRKANFLMKEFWFFFPLKYLLKALGGIPVRRSKPGNRLSDKLIRLFDTNTYINLAVTPEGTRSACKKWHTGFLHIAYGAKVPIQLGIIDYRRRRIIIQDEYHPTGVTDEDLKAIMNYYAGWKNCARYPEQFEV